MMLTFYQKKKGNLSVSCLLSITACSLNFSIFSLCVFAFLIVSPIKFKADDASNCFSANFSFWVAASFFNLSTTFLVWFNFVTPAYNQQHVIDRIEIRYRIKNKKTFFSKPLILPLYHLLIFFSFHIFLNMF